MPLDWKYGSLAEGLSCYQREEFFEAHEHWESVWLKLEEPEKSFLQALIQMTAAFHHLRSGNQAGARSLLRRTQRRLEDCPACFGGVEIASMRDEIREWVHGIEGGMASPTAFPQIRLS